MKFLTIIGIMLTLALPAIGADPVFPASTNANQTFTGTNSFTGEIHLDKTATSIGSFIVSNQVASTHWQLSQNGTGLMISGKVGPGAFNPITDLVMILDTNGTLYVNNLISLASSTSNSFLLLSGGTLGGPVLTISSSSNSPANLELPTAGWVRDLVGGSGQVFYNSTNIAIGFTNADVALGTNFTYVTNIPLYAARTYVNPANGTYFGSVTTTNKFLALNAGVEVSTYLSVDSGGSGTAGPLVKPEIYVSYDGTNWLGDWDGPAQNIPEGNTNMYSWVVGNPYYTSTNGTGFYIQRRLKMVTQPTPSASQVTVHIGGAFPSHVHFGGSTITSGNAFLAVDQTFTGLNKFTRGILTPTNSSLQSVDLNLRYSDFATNAAFAFLGFLNVSLNDYQSTVVIITNTTGSVFNYTAPANCHFQGTMNVTNVTVASFFCSGGRWTNLLSLPQW